MLKVLRHGPVDFIKLHVTTALNLRRGEVVDHPFICRRCKFKGLTARRATFMNLVDLRGSTITGPVDMSEASFSGPAIFLNTFFGRKADLSLAAFGGLAMLQGAHFKRSVDFSLARFEGDSIFALGGAKGRADFERSTFFGTADFGAYQFKGDASFTDANFRGRTDFSQVTFTKEAIFERTRFDQGATFQSGTFGESGNPTGNLPHKFDGVSAAGSLKFAFATFYDRTSFKNVEAVGPLSFARAIFDATCEVLAGTTTKKTTQCIEFEYVSAGGFDMSVNDVRRAIRTPDEQRVALRMVESSAQARGDLALANDAHYELQAMKNRALIPHVLDVMFYRTIAGYFVRPLHPLLALLVLATMMSLVRAIRHGANGARAAAGGSPVGATSKKAGSDPAPSAREGTPAPTPRHQALHRGGSLAFHTMQNLGHEILTTLALIGRQRGDAGDAAGRRFEIFVYRVLVVLALIGFANSNPTLRQMLDDLR